MKIMICTDGSAGSVQSAELVTKFGFPSDTSITVLGVSERQDDPAMLNASMDQIGKALGKKYQLERIIRKGDPTEEIISEALESPCDLVVLGGGGMQIDFLHPRLGSTTSKLARKLNTHFLVTRKAPAKLSRVLICAGVEAPSNMTMRLGGRWLVNTRAQISLLHVLAKNLVSVKRGKNDHNELNESVSQRDQDATNLLENANHQLREAGIKNQIDTLVRYGMIVDEVIKELSDGQYDLLVVGAHYQPGQDRWQGTLLDDITDQLLNQAPCSVLII